MARCKKVLHHPLAGASPTIGGAGAEEVADQVAIDYRYFQKFDARFELY